MEEKTLWSFFLINDDKDEEEIIKIKAINTGEPLWLPLGTSDPNEVEFLTRVAKAIGQIKGKRVRIVRFVSQISRILD